MQKFNIVLWMLLLRSITSSETISAQNLMMLGSMGQRTDLRTNSSGFQQHIGLHRPISPRWSIGITLGHGYTESQSEILKEDNPKHLIRSVKQPIPEGVPNGSWNEEAFPGIDIKDKGNRYDDIFLSLSASYAVVKHKKNNILMGVGLGIHKRDHSEQISSIEAKEISWIFGGYTTTDGIIPVYTYNTFLDYSILPSVVYEYILRPRLGLTFESVAVVYPASSSVALSQSVGFRLRF